MTFCYGSGILGSVPLASGSGSGSCSFRQWPSRCQQKLFSLRFFAYYFLKIHLYNSSQIKSHKMSQNSRNLGFLTLFAWWWKDLDRDPNLWLTDLGGPKTYGSGSGTLLASEEIWFTGRKKPRRLKSGNVVKKKAGICFSSHSHPFLSPRGCFSSCCSTLDFTETKGFTVNPISHQIKWQLRLERARLQEILSIRKFLFLSSKQNF